MIEISAEDTAFKESTEYRDKKENILSAANIMGMIDTNETLLDLVKNKKQSLAEILMFMLHWNSCSYGLSDYVCKRIVIFEQEQKSNEEVADWLRRLARKIELNQSDIDFKKSLDAKTKESIELAAKALENSKRQQTLHGEDAAGERRSSLGVLLDFMNVNGQRWDGGIFALSKNIGDITMRKNRKNADEEKENLLIAKQELSSRLSAYIVKRIGYFDSYEHYSFREVAQWLRLFLN